MRWFGNPNFNTIAVGGDNLVVAGTVIFVEVEFISYNLFQFTQLLGGPICLLGE